MLKESKILDMVISASEKLTVTELSWTGNLHYRLDVTSGDNTISMMLDKSQLGRLRKEKVEMQALLAPVLLKAESVLIHDDDCGAILLNGRCPKCNFHPDMQSTAFIYTCPKCKVRLQKDNRCGICREQCRLE